MDLKNLATNFALLQTFLSGAGFFASNAPTTSFFANLKYYVVAMIVLATVGICFVLVGLYLYLITVMEPYQVCMIMGGVIFALALAVLLSRVFVFYMIKRKMKDSVKDVYKDIKEVLGDMVEQVEKPISQSPMLAVAIALLAGFIISKKFFKDE